MRLVPTVENKADRMTRVPKKWLGHRGMSGGEAESMAAAIFTGESLGDAVWAAHLPHHLGVKRTLYLAQQVRSDLTWEQVKRKLAGCKVCQRIDPALRGENFVETGRLAVEENWCRLAIDVIHYGSQVFLSMVDCGPSHFAIWRRLPSEMEAHIVAQLRTVVIKRGSCDELLMDNSMAFRSATVAQFFDKWGISLRCRTAYAPSGNGIVERNHQTIERIAKRGRISPEDAMFWLDEVSQGKFAVGDEVWVKPSTPSCTRQWAPGVITGVFSKHNMCVNGMPRHVRDVRKRRFGTDRSRENSIHELVEDGRLNLDRLRASAALPPPQLHPREVAEVSEGNVEDGLQTANNEVQNMDGEPQSAGVLSGDLNPDEPELQPSMLRWLQRERLRPR
ncbi:uncharacterized protein [Watersipora subatra]|uniref:uncharacterized protein n=1 Tax=Watersipora subatra TaxID=2589382 RepID=UPI00355B772A